MKLLPGFLGGLAPGAVAVLGLLLLAVAALGVKPREAAADHCAILVASLSGPAIDGVRPSGKADWKGNDLCNLGLELKVQLSSVSAFTDPASRPYRGHGELMARVFRSTAGG